MIVVWLKLSTLLMHTYLVYNQFTYYLKIRNSYFSKFEFLLHQCHKKLLLKLVRFFIASSYIYIIYWNRFTIIIQKLSYQFLSKMYTTLSWQFFLSPSSMKNCFALIFFSQLLYIVNFFLLLMSKLIFCLLNYY